MTMFTLVLQFRDLMMSIDPIDEDDSGDEQRSTGAATPGRKSPAPDGAEANGDNSIIIDGVQTPAGDHDANVRIFLSS